MADFLLNIEAACTAWQVVVSEQLTLPAGLEADCYTDPVLANRLLWLRAPQGRLVIRYDAVVDIDHHLEDGDKLLEIPVAELPFDVLPYLAPSRYCESDRLMEFASREFGGMQRSYARVYAIREWVRNHVRFLSRSTNERTSAADTIVERTGVCRDFAHVMIALCRALSIPARMSSMLRLWRGLGIGGAGLPRGSGNLPGAPVLDPSGISIRTGLLRICTGRDASDIPFAAIFGQVSSERPVVEIEPLTDAAAGIGMPVFTSKSISTW